MIFSKRIIFFIFQLLALHVCGQSLKWSQPLQDEKKWPYLSILGTDEQGFYVLRSNMPIGDDRQRIGFRSRRYELDYYNDALLMVRGSPLNVPCKDCHIADIAMLGSQAAMLYSIFSKTDKLLEVYIQKIESSGKLNDNKILLMKINAARFDEDVQPDLIFSQDQRLAACAFRTLTKDKEQQNYSIAVFDSSLNILYRKDINVPVKESRFLVNTMLLTDAGNFFLLGTEFTTDKRIKSPDQMFFKLYSCSIKDQVTSVDVKIENKFLTDVAMSADNLNHKVVIAGFYSDRTTYSSAGVFYYALSEDTLTNAGTIVSAPFSTDFLSKNFLDRTKKSKQELANYTINKIVVRRDAGAAIIAESQYTTTQSYYDPFLRSFVLRYYYHFGNIISVSINPDGSLLWSNVVNKDQNSVDDYGYYSSYYPAIVGGRIRLFYNKFLKIPTSVLSTSIKGTGEQSTDILINESQNAMVVPANAKQVEESTIVMPAYKDDKQYLLKISY